MNEGISQLFIKPNHNLTDKSSPDYLTMVNLSKKQVLDRWSNPKGQEILAALQGNEFARARECCLSQLRLEKFSPV